MKSAADMDALAIEIQDRGRDLEIVGTLDLVQVVHVQLERVQRAAGPFAIGRIEPQVIHDIVNGVAHRHAVIGIAQVPVVVDPIGLDWRDKRAARSRALAQRSCSLSRACAGSENRAHPWPR